MRHDRMWFLVIGLFIVGIFIGSLWVAWGIWSALCDTYLTEFCEAL